MSSSIHIPNHVFALYSLDDFNEQDFPEINDIISKIKSCLSNIYKSFHLIFFTAWVIHELKNFFLFQ